MTKWLSEGAEVLAGLCRAPQPVGPDAVVIGSGYGGAVAADRLTAAGLTVWVLERGAEYLAGDFPSRTSEAPAHVRTESGGPGGVRTTGYEGALFDFRLGDGVAALVGNGLGGGSLINAAVALRPDDRVFDRSDWPAALRDGRSWAEAYDRARAGLGVQDGAVQREQAWRSPQQTLKRQRLDALGAAARAQARRDVAVRVEDVPLAIEFRSDPPAAEAPRLPCVGCGNCVSGCNQHAKLSLDKTYLARARRQGARLFTQVSVLWLSQRPATAGGGWVLHCVRTDERALWAAVAEQDPALAAERHLFELPCPQVVLAAGAFGSTELLMRSAQHGLPLATQALGRRVSANGDDLSAVYALPEPVDGFGVAGEAVGTPGAPVVGPTISGVVRFDDPRDVRASTVTEDGGMPGLLQPLVAEILTSLAVLPQGVRWGWRSGGQADPLAVGPAARAHSLALLGMGHDSGGGEMQLASARGRLSWLWRRTDSDLSLPLHRERVAAVESLGGIFLPNPASGVLPDEMAHAMSKADYSAPWITVHPLGGCRMADTAGEGVVNDRCEVYGARGGVLPGLFVMDGSVVPSSLGVNPLLTITALAERACDIALRTGRLARTGHAPAEGPALGAYPRPVVHPRDRGAAASAAQAPRGGWLNEVLRGPLRLDLSAWCGRVGGPPWPAGLPEGTPAEVAASLYVEMDVRDWEALWADPLHQAPVVPGAGRETLTEQRLTASRLVLDWPEQGPLHWPVTGGWVRIFHPSGGRALRRALRALGLLATYGMARWLAESQHPGDGTLPHPQAPGLWGKASGALKGVWHAAAVRAFTYELELDAGGTPLRLSGTKWISPLATWAEAWAWLRGLRRESGRWLLPALQRRSVWDQLTQLDLRLTAPGGARALAQGRLAMDLPEMARRIAPQLQPGPDTIEALAAFFSYPALIARHLLYSRMLDFRYPDHVPGLPQHDWAQGADDGRLELQRAWFSPLQLPGGAQVEPAEPVGLVVPLRAGLLGGQAGGDTIRTGLVRYAQPRVQATEVDGHRRYRAILLMNGFAQNTLPFVAPELGSQTLASQLYAQGWDVWLFEYRVSPFLRASARFSTMDDIAAGEIPAAVDHVLATLAAEQGGAPLPGQLFMFSHCVGSASLAMSVLGGRLRHAASGRSKLAGVLFSQFQPFVVGSATAQMRLQVATGLVSALGLDYLQFAAGTVAPDGLHALLDRLFASFSYAESEHCPHEHDLARPQPDATSCKRMAGLLSRLFRHDQLLPETHARLDQYFGRTNLGVFMHGARCVEGERLVNADGQDVYVTERQLARYLDMPVMLLHGQDNVLFNRESLVESQRQLLRTFSAERQRLGLDRFLEVPEHAHFDCTIGRLAPQLIFPQVTAFFDGAYRAPRLAAAPARRLRARLPLTGPLIGWTRQEGDDTVMRVWIEVDDQHTDRTLGAMTVLYVGGRARAQVWRVRRAGLRTQLPAGHTVASGALSLRYACADLRWPTRESGTVSVLMVSLHRYRDGRESGPEDMPASAGLAEGGQPMTLAEARHAQGRTPSELDGAAPGRAPALRRAGPGRAPLGDEIRPAAPGADRRQLRSRPLGLAEAEALLRPLAASLQAARDRALAGQPDTLARQVRRVRYLRQAWLRVRPATWKPAPQGVDWLAVTCRHPGLTPLEAWRSDDRLAALARAQQTEPAAMAWMLGDQIYADASGGIADSFSPIDRFLPRYRAAFNSNGFSALARQLPLHMVMDDHEVADNWSRDWLAAGPQHRLMFDNAWLAHRVFQESRSRSGLSGRDIGFDWGGVAFYRLNTRVNRERQGAGRMLSTGQWAALERWLLAEQARGAHPKVLASGSVVAPGLRELAGPAPDRGGDTWQSCPAERQRLLSFIARHRIQGVVLLSGDYHCAAWATLDFGSGGLSACAVVAPPLHAPMRFANVAMTSLLATETVTLAPGLGEVRIETQALEGDGWVRLGCRQRPGGGWDLEARYHCLPIDAAGPVRPRHFTVRLS